MTKYPYAWVYYATEVYLPQTPGWYWTGVYGEGDFGHDHGPWPTEAEAIADVGGLFPVKTDEDGGK